MKKYVIQVYDYAPYTHRMRKMWRTLPGLEFDTLEEAKATFARLEAATTASPKPTRRPATNPCRWKGAPHDKTKSGRPGKDARNGQ